MEAELGVVKEVLDQKSIDLSNLETAMQLVLEDLGMPASGETSQLVPQLLQSVDGVRDVVQRVLHLGVQCSFAITRSHYNNINLQEMS